MLVSLELVNKRELLVKPNHQLHIRYLEKMLVLQQHIPGFPVP